MAWGCRIEILDRVGAFDTMSCSPAGLGGFTGARSS
jgi:hypothetical protein